MTPTAEKIARRLRVKLDGRQALRWRALGFDVEVRLSPLGNFKPFPATQEEAEQAVREIVAERRLGYLKYKMITDRLDRAREENHHHG